MGLDCFPELSLDLSSEFAPKTISGFLSEVKMIKDSYEKISKVENYVAKLEEEMKKIDAFKRELPLCMLLLNDAIGVLKEEVEKCRKEKDRIEMEGFRPLKGNLEKDGRVSQENDKKSWMSSVQLWNTDNTDHDLSSVLKLGSDGEEDNSASKKSKSRDRGGAFMSFNMNPGFEAKKTRGSNKEVVVPISGLSLMPPNPMVELGSRDVSLKNSNCGREGLGSSLFTNQPKLQNRPYHTQQQPQQQQVGRKQRRCWSNELHRRFVSALQQLGGSQVATPKQIREIMQVDGLTNDEVKSHLQKYRLHVRKLPSSSGTEDGLTMSQDDKPKAKNPQSGSPKGPLQTSGSGKGMSTTCGDSMEEVEDEEFEGHSWTTRIHNLGE